jgi:hypothetical protein
MTLPRARETIGTQEAKGKAGKVKVAKEAKAKVARAPLHRRILAGSTRRA